MNNDIHTQNLICAYNKDGNYVRLTGEEEIKFMNKLLEALEDNDDVQNVWHNWENEGEGEEMA